MSKPYFIELYRVECFVNIHEAHVQWLMLIKFSGFFHDKSQSGDLITSPPTCSESSLNQCSVLNSRTFSIDPSQFAISISSCDCIVLSKIFSMTLTGMRY